MKALKNILLLFAVSRMLIYLFLSVGQPDQIHYTDNQVQLDNPILDRFITYDSYNYQKIASGGYAEDRLTAFFPLFPMVVRGLYAVTGIDIYWAGFLLSNFFFVCSLWLLNQLMERRGLPERTRLLVLAILGFFPSSYFFSAFYTESFFLFLALFAFRCWGDGKRGAAYFIGGLAALTRMVGVWIPAAFFLERVIRRKWDGKDFAGVFVSGLMFAGYPVYLWLTKGDPLLFLKVMAPDYGRYSTVPFVPIYEDIVSSVYRFQQTGLIEPIIVLHLMLFTVFIGYVISVIRLQRKGTAVVWSELIYTFGLIATPLSSVLIRAVHIPSHGFMRYFLTVFPLFIFMGERSDRALTLADERSGVHFVIVRKAVNYLILFVWVLFAVYIFLLLRQKGFVA